MSQPFVGQMIAVGFNFAPVGWLLCNGQTVPISQYEALYTLIGTTYGGDGQTNFALPDLRGRSPLCMGTGSGLPTFVQGQVGGSETVSLASAQIGAHNHPLQVSANAGNTQTPANNLVLGNGGQPDLNVYAPTPSTTTLSGTSIGSTGGNVPHENRQPFLVVNYIIAAEGIYPSQG